MRRPPVAPLPDTLVPSTWLFRSNLDFRADADPPRHADVPAGLLGEVAHLEQAEAGAALAFGREERLEDLLENVGRNATAGIGHRHADIVAARQEIGRAHV